MGEINCLKRHALAVVLVVSFVVAGTTALDAAVNQSTVPVAAPTNDILNVSVNPSGETEYGVRFELRQFYRDEVVSHYCSSVDLQQYLRGQIMYIRNGELTSVSSSVSRIVVYGFDSLCDDMFDKSDASEIGENNTIREDRTIAGTTLVHSSFQRCGNPHRCVPGNAQTLFVWSLGDGERPTDFGVPPVYGGLQVDLRYNSTTNRRRRKRSVTSNQWNVGGAVMQDRIRHLFVVVDFRNKDLALQNDSKNFEFAMTVWLFHKQPPVRVGLSSFQLPPTVKTLPSKLPRFTVDIPCMYSVPPLSNIAPAFSPGLQPLAVRVHTRSRGRAVLIAHLNGQYASQVAQTNSSSSNVAGTNNGGNQPPLADPNEVLKPQGGAKNNSTPRKVGWTLIAVVDPRKPQVFYPAEKNAVDKVLIRSGDYLLIRCIFDTQFDIGVVEVQHNASAEQSDALELCNAHLRYATRGDLPPTSLGDGSFMHCLPLHYPWLGRAFDTDLAMRQAVQNASHLLESGNSNLLIDPETYSFTLASDYALLNDPQTQALPPTTNSVTGTTPTPMRFDPDSFAATKRPATRDELQKSAAAASYIQSLARDKQILQRSDYAIFFDLAQTWSVASDASGAIYVVFATSRRMRSIDRFDDSNAYTELLNGYVDAPTVLRLRLVDGAPPNSTARDVNSRSATPIGRKGEVDISLLTEGIDKLPQGTVGYANVTGHFGTSRTYFAYRVRWFADANSPCIVWLCDIGVHMLLQFATRTSVENESPIGAFPPERPIGPEHMEHTLCKPTDLLYNPERGRLYVADGLCNQQLVVMRSSTGEFEKTLKMFHFRPTSLSFGPNDTVCVGDYDSFTIDCYSDPMPSKKSPEPSLKLLFSIKPRLSDADLAQDVLESYRVKTMVYATNRQVFYVAAQQRFGANVSMLVVRASDGLLLGRFDDDAAINSLDFTLSRDEQELYLVNGDTKTVSRIRLDVLPRNLSVFKMDCVAPQNSVLKQQVNTHVVLKAVQTESASSNLLVVILATALTVCLFVGLFVYCLKRPHAYLVFNRSRFEVTCRNVLADVCYCFRNEHKDYAVVPRERGSSDLLVETSVTDTNAASARSDEPGCSYRADDNRGEFVTSENNGHVGFTFASRKRNDRMALLDSDEEC